MAGERKYTRIPPESTGDRVYMIHTAEINYDGKDPSHVWQIGERYTITGNSGDTFTVHVHGAYEATSTTGRLAVHYSEEAKEKGWVASDDQSIQYDTDDDDVLETVATVNTDAYDIYIPAQNIMGYDNPEYGWDIDRFGSGQVTFADGAPELTEFGELRTSEKTLLAQYMFTKSRLASEFSNALIGAGSLAHEDGFGAVRLDVGDTLNDQSTHTSNVYHPFIPGMTNLTIMATRIGDTGSTGLVRNWGTFDATDGFFFSLWETELRVYHRRTFSGTTTNGFITQSDWNRDTLDGSAGASNPSGFELKVDRNNIYWIDFQNIGGGRIRWGVFVGGARIVCHEMDMGNGAATGNFLHNSLGNPNRPICWSTKCISGTPGYSGTKSMYAYGASVWAEGLGQTNIMEEGDLRALDTSYALTIDTPRTQGAQYLFSVRPAEQIPSEIGTLQENHSLYLPKFLTIDAYDQNTNDVRGELRIFSQCILKGENYDDITYSTLELDEDAFHVGHGPEIFRKPVKGPTEIDFTKLFHTIQNGSLKVNAETTTSVRSQAITKVTGNDAPYDGNGNPSNAVTIQIGANPVLGTSVHFFADKNLITVSGLSVDGPTNLNGNEYYLSLQDSNEAQLYVNLADLVDDRKTRTITYSSLSGGTLDIGDVLTVTGGGTCIVKTTGNGANTVVVEGRTSIALDSVTSVSANTDSGATTFTVDSVSVNSEFPIDRYTVINAVTNSGWANDDEGTGSTNIGLITGTPPTQPAWTFMWDPVDDGYVTHTTQNVRINLQWKERIQ